jgi:hypothetical protein
MYPFYLRGKEKFMKCDICDKDFGHGEDPFSVGSFWAHANCVANMLLALSKIFKALKYL